MLIFEKTFYEYFAKTFFNEELANKI